MGQERIYCSTLSPSCVLDLTAPTVFCVHSSRRRSFCWRAPIHCCEHPGWKKINQNMCSNLVGKERKALIPRACFVQTEFEGGPAGPAPLPHSCCPQLFETRLARNMAFGLLLSARGIMKIQTLQGSVQCTNPSFWKLVPSHPANMHSPRVKEATLPTDVPTEPPTDRATCFTRPVNSKYASKICHSFISFSLFQICHIYIFRIIQRRCWYRKCYCVFWICHHI